MGSRLIANRKSKQADHINMDGPWAATPIGVIIYGIADLILSYQSAHKGMTKEELLKSFQQSPQFGEVEDIIEGELVTPKKELGCKDSSKKQALDAMLEELAKPTKDDRTDLDYVSPFSNKRNEERMEASIKMHKEPRQLPPRKDNRTLIDQEEKDELDVDKTSNLDYDEIGTFANYFVDCLATATDGPINPSKEDMDLLIEGIKDMSDANFSFNEEDIHDFIDGDEEDQLRIVNRYDGEKAHQALNNILDKV